MNDTWVKLYRKIGDHEILTDPNALVIFIYLMTNCNLEGKASVSKYFTAGGLKMKPDTFYGALKRLENKYKVITCVTTTNHTEVTLSGWAKYQPHLSDDKHETNTNQTPDKHQPKLYKEYKNKELKNIKEREYLENLPPEDLQEFTDSFNCSKDQVMSKAKTVVDYCKANGKKYKDYKATLRNWLRKDYGDRIKVIKFIPSEHELTPEQRAAGLLRLEEIKRQRSMKGMN